MALQNYSIQPMKTMLQERYYIPNYQREYSWEKDEVSDFLRDLDETINDPEIFHFFGQVVIHNEDDKKKYIIDGQQRTTTSMIFLRVLQIFYSDLYLKNPQLKSANKKSFAI